jgi:hypothetical protein
LTGAPGTEFEFEDNADLTWTFLEKAIKDGYVMTVGTKDDASGKSEV